MRTDKLIDNLDEILRGVGDRLLQWRSDGLSHGIWHGAQLKMEADKSAEKFIVSALQKLPTRLPIITEEDELTHCRDRYNRYWLIDPIDGTASYAQGYSGFVTQIALMECDQPVLAVVFAPAQERMYVAELGGGATLNGQNIYISESLDVSRITMIDNYPHPSGISARLYDSLGADSYIESGSIGLKICRIADGSATLFVKNVVIRDWDIAPGQLILSEARGYMSDLSGNPILYKGSLEKTTGLLAAASQKLICQVVGLLTKEGKHV